MTDTVQACLSFHVYMYIGVIKKALGLSFSVYFVMYSCPCGVHTCVLYLCAFEHCCVFVVFVCTMRVCISTCVILSPYRINTKIYYALLCVCPRHFLSHNCRRQRPDIHLLLRYKSEMCVIQLLQHTELPVKQSEYSSCPLSKFPF